MTMAEIQQQALEQLSAEERRELAAVLWESSGAIEMSGAPDWHLPLVRESLAEYRANPEDTLSWEEVEQQLERR